MTVKASNPSVIFPPLVKEYCIGCDKQYNDVELLFREVFKFYNNLRVCVFNFFCRLFLNQQVDVLETFET